MTKHGLAIEVQLCGILKDPLLSSSGLVLKPIAFQQLFLLVWFQGLLSSKVSLKPFIASPWPLGWVVINHLGVNENLPNVSFVKFFVRLEALEGRL